MNKSEQAQWVKVLATKPAQLSWPPRVHMVTKRTTLTLSSDLHTHWHTEDHPKWMNIYVNILIYVYK